MASHLFSSESVTEGHPDKLCDAVSDSILDAILKDDPNARVACETFTKTGFVLVGGEVTTSTYVDIPTIVRSAVQEIGYTGSDMGFDAATCGVMVALEQQSPDIARGVDRGDAANQGAGDQGLMFGYASDETKELMPLPIQLAHQLAYRLAQVRKKKVNGVSFLRPDGKTQVSVRYENDVPVGIEAIVVSTQHAPGYYWHNGEGDEAKYQELRKYVLVVIADVLPAELLTANTVYHINPTGRFEIGGPDGDAGLTGRKIIVDTYGGAAPHGGGAFSGKDTTKVDRSAAYVARYLAKNVVASGVADRCTIQLSYAIGVAQPLSIYVDLHGTGKGVTEDQVEAAIRKVIDLSPSGIRRHLNLNKPIYAKTSAYGHFGRKAGRDGSFSWEKLDLVKPLKDALKA